MRALVVISSACKGTEKQLTLENHLQEPSSRLDTLTHANFQRPDPSSCATVHVTLRVSSPLSFQLCASSEISGNQIKGKNLSRINRRRSVGCNRDVKVNVK